MDDPKVFPFPRPLEEIAVTNSELNASTIPKIGSFGFGTPGKGFIEVIKAVENEFEQALIRINIPNGDFVPPYLYDACIDEILQYEIKKGIDLELTHHYFSKKELVKWCGENTLNVFLYTRNQPGLSATTDQAIISGSPMAVSENTTFRHIHEYLTPYPARSLKQAIELSLPELAEMRRDWTPINFSRKFEAVIKTFNVKKNTLNKRDLILTKTPSNLESAINFSKRVVRKSLIVLKIISS